MGADQFSQKRLQYHLAVREHPSVRWTCHLCRLGRLINVINDVSVVLEGVKLKCPPSLVYAVGDTVEHFNLRTKHSVDCRQRIGPFKERVGPRGDLARSNVGVSRFKPTSNDLAEFFQALDFRFGNWRDYWRGRRHDGFPA